MTAITINIPDNITDASASLFGIENLLTAKGWARCAIVAAYVQLEDVGGDRITNVTSDRLSPSQFANLDIAAKCFDLGFALLGKIGDCRRQLLEQGSRLIEGILTLT